MSESGELVSFVASMAGEGGLRVEENLGAGFVRLRVAEAERRQAKHDIQHVEDIVIECLRNSRDAGATHIYLASNKEEKLRSLVFIDDGCGVPASMRARIFDARVTSKLDSLKMDRWGVHGRGMALFSIAQNTQEARVVDSGEGLGTALLVKADTDTLSERSDQSSWPKATKDEEGSYICVQGPHNIVRSACEFALEEQHDCDVYLGTPAEIAATLFAHAQQRLDARTLLFIDDPSELAVVDRLGAAGDARDLVALASTLGLEISERTAHRIFAGSIESLRSVASRLLRERITDGYNAHIVDLERDRRSLKISREDLSQFARVVERDFSELAERYYLTLSAAPRVRVSHDHITVTFEVTNTE